LAQPGGSYRLSMIWCWDFSGLRVSRMPLKAAAGSTGTFKLHLSYWSAGKPFLEKAIFGGCRLIQNQAKSGNMGSIS
jgi:hypothetical protein